MKSRRYLYAAFGEAGVCASEPAPCPTFDNGGGGGGEGGGRQTAAGGWQSHWSLALCHPHLNPKTPESSCRECDTELRCVCVCGMQAGGGWVPPEAAAAAVDHATLFSSWACPACTLINAPQVLFLLTPVLLTLVLALSCSPLSLLTVMSVALSPGMVFLPKVLKVLHCCA